MTLQSLNVNVLSPALTAAWKKQLNTGEDPANGRWYTDGANHDGVGLYGGLSDALPTGLDFDESKLTYLPKQIIADSAIVNNVNGLLPTSTMTLTYTHTDSTTVSHTTTNAVSTTLGAEVKGGVDFMVKGEVTFKFSVSYTFSYSSTTSTTSSDAQTFSQQVPVTVPTGRIYKGVLLATVQSIDVPYAATIQVDGRSETWFEDRIQGHYNWIADAGTAFGWINQYGTAGSDSANYRNIGGGKGGVTVWGILHSSQTANFQAQVYDVTDSGDDQLASSPAVITGDESPVPGGQLVQTIDF